jgi:hypothetical protein
MALIETEEPAEVILQMDKNGMVAIGFTDGVTLDQMLAMVAAAYDAILEKLEGGDDGEAPVQATRYH